MMIGSDSMMPWYFSTILFLLLSRFLVFLFSLLEKYGPRNAHKTSPECSYCGCY